MDEINKMEDNLVFCIPGNWGNRLDLLEAIVNLTKGDFMFAGLILADTKNKDHISLEFFDAYEGMSEAFRYGGQGKVSNSTLEKIKLHKSVVYLSFPFGIISQKERISKFTKLIADCGGLGIKVETSGVAHEWSSWFELIKSKNSFDQYIASVVLVGDEKHYYSCGMHNFELEDAQISTQFSIEESADFINQFNYWRICEKPVLQSGHMFSLTEDSPHFRLELLDDNRHEEDNLFNNPNGIWDLTVF